MSEKKYRPYLTVAQMQAIQSCFASIDNPTILDVSIEKYLRKYLRDIDEGFTSPNYIQNKNPRIEKSLGITNEDLIPILLSTSLSELNLEQVMLLVEADSETYSISPEKEAEINARYMELFLS